jgi:beta-galactosidase
MIWSLGNEEWGIEGNVKGARITATMQRFAQTLDPSRVATVACSGGWDTGSGMAAQVMGYNYIVQATLTSTTPVPLAGGRRHRGDDHAPDARRLRERSTARPPRTGKPDAGKRGHRIGWQFYAARPFLVDSSTGRASIIHGEPSPPAGRFIVGQFGLCDLCGFPKDGFYYLKAWWGKAPVLHIAAHWTWPGREGQAIPVTVYGNCEEVELFLNGLSRGRQAMPVNGHLEWEVAYAPGTLQARGYRAGQVILTTEVATAGPAAALYLTAERLRLHADGADVAVVTVQVRDAQGRLVPTAGTRFTSS